VMRMGCSRIRYFQLPVGNPIRLLLARERTLSVGEGPRATRPELAVGLEGSSHFHWAT
jgi:hypothetical protein